MHEAIITHFCPGSWPCEKRNDGMTGEQAHLTWGEEGHLGQDLKAGQPGLTWSSAELRQFGKGMAVVRVEMVNEWE